MPELDFHEAERRKMPKKGDSPKSGSIYYTRKIGDPPKENGTDTHLIQSQTETAIIHCQ
jgi:hypothetical protein